MCELFIFLGQLEDFSLQSLKVSLQTMFSWLSSKDFFFFNFYVNCIFFLSLCEGFSIDKQWLRHILKVFPWFLPYYYIVLYVFLQMIVKDFSLRCIQIIQEAMRWAPNATRSHLIEYLVRIDNMSKGLYQHSGLALATESVLSYAGYNRRSKALGVSL